MLLIAAPVLAHEGYVAAISRLTYDLSRVPDGYALRVARADLALRTKKKDLVREDLAWLLARPIDRGEVAALVGGLFAVLDDRDTALAYLQLAVELDPTRSETFRQRAHMLAETSPAESARDFGTAAMLSASPDIWYECADHCRKHPSVCDAAEWYLLGYAATAAPALELSAVQTFIARGDLLLARPIVERALAARPSSRLWAELRAKIEAGAR